MSKRNQMVLWIFGLPFVISASVEFLPAWVSWPIAFLGAMQWLGACTTLAELNKEKAGEA
jgi:hypothetical protein